MKVNFIKFFVINVLAVFFFLTVGIIFAQDKSDQTSPKKERINCLRELERRISPGVEKEFFLALERQESAHLDLIKVGN